MMQAERGILYVATGEKFVAEAEVSARSVKLLMPAVPVALISDLGSRSPDFDIQLPLAEPRRNFSDKILGMLASPFQQTLFLDSDTFALKPFDHLFELLGRFDLAAALEPARGLYPIPPVPAGFPELNTGVVLYRIDRVRGVLADWRVRYDEEIASRIEAGRTVWHDQLSFTRAVYTSDVQFFVLPPEYNCRIIFPQAVSGPVYVIHARLKNAQRYDRAFASVNREVGPRLFNPNPGRLPALVYRTLKLFSALKRG